MAIKNNNILDINKYVKHPWDKVKDDVERLKNPDNITTDLLVELFSATPKEQSDTGEITVEEPKYRITDWFDLPANTLNNQPQSIETTFGIFVFNALVINNAFHSKVAYINEVLDAKNFGKLHSVISQHVVEKTITVEEYGEFINTVLWLGYQTELFMPGVSTTLVIPRKSVKELKVKLLKENPQFLKTDKNISTDEIAEYVDNIEKPLLKKANEEISQDPSSRLYDLKKPSFGNNYKNGYIENGPMLDTKTGGYRLNNNSFNDGSNADNFDLLANKAMFASYSRGVNTAKGGTYAKYTNSMMQAVILDDEGSDCGTTKYMDYAVTKDNEASIRYNFALINGKLTRLDPELLKGLIGKTIKMRSPLYCKSKNHICNKCAGDSFYLIGIKNVGLTSNIPMNASLNKSMKAMHDLSVKTTQINPEEYILFTK